MIDYDKYNKQIPDDMEEQVKNVAEQGDYEDVPPAAYEVEIEKLELTESKKGKPMLSAWFRIIGGDYNKYMLFYNQVVDVAFGIHKANEFLKSLGTSVKVEWKNDYREYDNMILDIKEKIDKSGKTFRLEYGQNEKNDFKTFDITEVYDN